MRNYLQNYRCKLDIFEKPYGAPRPTEPQNPPATKKRNSKNPENPDYPQK